MSKLGFNIYFNTQDGGSHLFSFNPYEEVVNKPPKLTLQASLPLNAIRYFLNLTLNGTTIYTNSAGFLTIADLWAYIQQNLVNIGQWFLLADKIVLYTNAQFGTLSIPTMSLTGAGGVQCAIPALDPADASAYYVVVFNGIASPDNLLYSSGDVLVFAQDNWGNDGLFQITDNMLVYTPNDLGGTNTLQIYTATFGAFSNGFNSGFN